MVSKEAPSVSSYRGVFPSIQDLITHHQKVMTTTPRGRDCSPRGERTQLADLPLVAARVTLPTSMAQPTSHLAVELAAQSAANSRLTQGSSGMLHNELNSSGLRSTPQMVSPLRAQHNPAVRVGSNVTFDMSTPIGERGPFGARTSTSPDGDWETAWTNSSDAERWRRAFRDEAHGCLEAVRNAAQDTDISQLAGQLSEWRHVHVEETTKLRESVHELVNITLTARRQADERAELQDVRSSKDNDMVLKKIDAEFAHVRERWHSDERRWAEVIGKIEYMQDRLDRIEGLPPEAMNNANRVLHSLENRAYRAYRPLVKRLVEALDEGMERISNHMTELGAIQSMAIEESSGRHAALLDNQREELRQHCAEISEVAMSQSRELALNAIEAMADHRPTSGANTAEATAPSIDLKSVTQSLKVLNDRTAEIYKMSKQPPTAALPSNLPFNIGSGDGFATAVEALREAEASSNAAKKAKTEAEEARAQLAAVQTKAEVLTHEVQELKGQLPTSRSQASLATIANGPSLSTSITRLETIERRGNVKVNLRNGDLELVKPLEFVARKPTDPVGAELSDRMTAEVVIADIVEVCNIFAQPPVLLEAHIKGGETPQAEAVAKARAQLIASALESRGLKNDTITTKGLPGKSGLNKTCIIVKMNLSSR
eukprot:NODE_789_length_2762_cov_6.394687.p1 GENE.NODE_789_length_2762_cov_6.394687~~NODE_789_length_2762_cov_6.394687.p1  ORF type:complete len:716 (-),score=138.42 NODE_789_length_2762_cov_6.394687:613-2586(-)